MRKVVFWGLALLLISASVKSASAQEQPKWTVPGDYEGYMAAYNEKDLAKKAANAEKFLDTFKTADPIARQQMYMMALLSYYSAQNWPKALEWSDKQAQVAPGLGADDKKKVPIIGMTAAEQTKNNAKLKSYSEKVLDDDPKNLGALVTLSGLLANTLPSDDAGKVKQLEETLVISKRALAVPRPAGAKDAEWNPIVIRLHDTSCMVLLNQKKYAEAIAACKEALKLDKKDGYAWYLMGMAMKPEVVTAIANYKGAVDNLNKEENRKADQVVRDELIATKDALDKVMTTKTDELIGVFASSVATGWQGAANPSHSELKAFTLPPGQLDQLIQQKKTEL